MFRDLVLTVSSLVIGHFAVCCTLDALQCLGDSESRVVVQVLLVPSQLVATSFNREELVALFNTLFKFSHAIKGQ